VRDAPKHNSLNATLPKRGGSSTGSKRRSHEPATPLPGTTFYRAIGQLAGAIVAAGIEELRLHHP
jgi:hypothetical protein